MVLFLVVLYDNNGNWAFDKVSCAHIHDATFYPIFFSSFFFFEKAFNFFQLENFWNAK